MNGPGYTSRRHFFKQSAALAAGAAAWTLPGAASRSAVARPAATDRLDDDLFWRSVQQSFAVDRSLIHLNNGGVCPAPEMVMEAQKQHQADANRRPFYAYRSEVHAQIESVRSRLGDCFGCDPEGLALTRNTSEGMEICQLGLDMAAGDEVLTTDQDYPRMLQTWAQRATRDGIQVTKVEIPVPLTDPDELVRSLEAAITPKTRIIMVCHMIDLTGQVLPIRDITKMASGYGIPVLVDGAQTLGQLPFRIDELGCDYFATSLHKWLMGPQGTGLLWMRRDLIGDLWPLMPSADPRSTDIRKFEDTGTHALGGVLALGAAMTFHQGIGTDQKFERLTELRDYWLARILRLSGVELLTNIDAAGALATIHVEGVDPVKLRNFLWDAHRIRVRPINTPSVKGIRVSPGIHTTFHELDTFTGILEEVVRNGLPA